MMSNHKMGHPWKRMKVSALNLISNYTFSLLEHSLQALQTHFFISLKSPFNKKS